LICNGFRLRTVIEHVYDRRMFERLAAKIEEVSIPVDGAALVEAFALVDRLQAKLTEAVADFDRAMLWESEGATSLTAWLRDRAGLTARRAHQCAAMARRLAGLPVTAAAWRAGQLSGGQVEAITAVTGGALVEVFAGHEAEVVPTLVGLSTVDTGRVMAHWKAHATADGTEPDTPERGVHLSRTLDGTGALDGTLSPEGYAVVRTALRVAETPDDPTEPRRSWAQRRHDALVEVCRHFLDHQHTRRGGRHRPHLNVIVNLDDLVDGRGGMTADGTPLDGVTIARLACDSALHRVLTAGRSTILDYGTAVRTTPVNLYNALVVLDGGCRWPGCDRPADWCDAHHVRWVTNGGETRIDNEVLLCVRHHHRAHQPGWNLHVHPDATLTVTDLTGAPRTTRPPGTLWPLVA
jgi:hypothetical protein